MPSNLCLRVHPCHHGDQRLSCLTLRVYIGSRIGELPKYEEFRRKFVWLSIDNRWLPVDAEYVQDPSRRARSATMLEPRRTMPLITVAKIGSYPQRVCNSNTLGGDPGAKPKTRNIVYVPLECGCALAILFTMPWTPQLMRICRIELNGA